MRARIWTSPHTQVLPTFDGPLQVHPGDVVVVAIVRSVADAAGLVADVQRRALELPPLPRPKGDL